VLQELARDQCGVLTRSQILRCGLTDGAIKANVDAGRWRRLFTGVYATFTGPPPRPAQLWAAVLRAGPGAMLSHESAAEVAGLVDRPAPKIHVTVPHRRTVHRIPGVVVHCSALTGDRCHPGRALPQTRIEETVVDLTPTAASVKDAVSWLAKAVGGRLTTAARLRAALRRRSRLRWQAALCSAVDDVAAGCHSLLELTYLRTVERAHGLPHGERQASRDRPRRGVAQRRAPTAPERGRGYDDVLFRNYATRVELDGRAAHPEHQRWGDSRSDNAVVVSGGRPLRYGLGEVLAFPCHVAHEVAATLRLGGWTELPHRCENPGCLFP
jgi:hypothetical protein